MVLTVGLRGPTRDAATEAVWPSSGEFLNLDKNGPEDRFPTLIKFTERLINLLPIPMNE